MEQIKPAHGTRAAVLTKMQKAAFEMIRVCELEKSGIRDGDGYWHGGDVLGGMMSDMHRLLRELGECYDQGGKPEAGPTVSPPPEVLITSNENDDLYRAEIYQPRHRDTMSQVAVETGFKSKEEALAWATQRVFPQKPVVADIPF